jgi:hypothetical protein
MKEKSPGLPTRAGGSPTGDPTCLNRHQYRRSHGECPGPVAGGRRGARPSCRRFTCARCGQETLICSLCDRGHRYCRQCAVIRRRESLHDAGRRYQRTRNGAKHHARRQARYRASRKNSDASGSTSPSPGCKRKSAPGASPVTAAGAALRERARVEAPSPAIAEAVGTPTESRPPRSGPDVSAPRCSFCGRHCSGPVRTELIKRRGHQTSRGAMQRWRTGSPESCDTKRSPRWT